MKSPRTEIALLTTLIPVLCVSASALAQHGDPRATRVEGRKNKTAGSTDANSTNELLARKLFLEGRALIKDGRPQEACVLLEQSNALSRTLATLLNLGLCHHHSGRLATAHEYFRRAEVEATLLGDEERREFAHDEAAAISSRRATLTLRVGGDAESLRVEIDGVPRAREVWAKPFFIDAGDHRISVQGKDGETWHGSVMVVDGGKHVVVIPQLRSGPNAALPAPAEVAPKVSQGASAIRPLAKVPESIPRSDSGLEPARVAALALGGTGIAALGVSFVFTLMASSAFDESEPLCDRADDCTLEGVRLRESAQAHATRATVIGISGGVAIAGGIALWFLSAGSEREERPTLSLRADAGRVSAQLRGVW